MIQKINSRTLAVRIAGLEGKKQQVNIAQISEVLAVARKLLADEAPSAVLRWLEECGAKDKLPE